MEHIWKLTLSINWMDDSTVTRSSASGQQMTNQNNTSSSRSGLSVFEHSDIHQTTANLSNRELISLTHLRPGPRPQNEYVDSTLSSSKLPPSSSSSSSSSSTVSVVKPLQSKKLQSENHLLQPHRFSNSSLTIATHSSPTLTIGNDNIRSGSGIASTISGATTEGGGGGSNNSGCSGSGGIGGAISSVRRSRGTINPAVISNQPISNQTLKKAPANVSVDLEGRGGSVHRDSVICSKCGKCKCGACREPRELPSWWFCGKRCEISAKSAVNICTCLCCVKGVFYHYSKNYQQDSVDGMCSDEPCAGYERPQCLKRWACMALLSLCLPCLCIYWPARCTLVCCTACYNGCSSRGCQCTNSENRTASTSQTRRLIESDGSSA